MRLPGGFHLLWYRNRRVEEEACSTLSASTAETRYAMIHCCICSLLSSLTSGQSSRIERKQRVLFSCQSRHHVGRSIAHRGL